MQRVAFITCLTLVLLAGCRERMPARPDGGPIPPAATNILVVNSSVGAHPLGFERWAAANGGPDALVLATGLPNLVLQNPSLAPSLSELHLAAFAVGPRELSFGREALDEVRVATRATWVLTNARARWPGSATFAVFQRNRIPIAVLGVSDVTGVDGFEDANLESVLASNIEAASKQAQVVVLLVNGCSSSVAAALRSHPEWKLDVVVAAPCDGTNDERIGAVTVLHPAAGEGVAVHVEVGQVRSLSTTVVPLVTPVDGGS